MLELCCRHAKQCRSNVESPGDEVEKTKTKTTIVAIARQVEWKFN